MNKVRRKLREGVVVTPDKFGVGEVSWAGGVSFNDLNNLPESVKWWFSCLGFLRLLFTHSPIQLSDELICKKIIMDFFENNPQSGPSFSRAWDGHAVALRAGVLIDLYDISLSGDYLSPLLKKHLDFLFLEENFQGHWNHGIDQSIALIKLGKCLDEKPAIDVGVARLCESLSILVDEEGVSIEQAIHYQLYNYKQVIRSVDIIKAVCDDQNILSMLDGLLNKQELMGSFLAHATKPDGSYFEIGDTPFQRAEIIDHKEADYAANLGEVGQAPKERYKVYQAGYIFGHSQWGKENEASAYAIRFGVPRIVHGHNDHSSVVYYTNGREVLREGGFHGYTDDENRRYLRSPRAHNLVYVENPDLKFKASHSILESSFISSCWQKYVISMSPYEGVFTRRSLVFSQDPEVMIVVDALDSEVEVRAVQSWHFGKGIYLEKKSHHEVTSSDGAVKLIQLYPFDSIEMLNEEDAGNNCLVSSGTMYDLDKCGSVKTARSGKEATFLTVISFSPNAEHPRVKHKKPKENGVRRVLEIMKEGRGVKVSFLNDGEISINSLSYFG